MSRRQHCFLFSSLLFVYSSILRQDRTGTRTGNKLHQCYIYSYKHFFVHIYITNRQKMWFNVMLNSKKICPCK